MKLKNLNNDTKEFIKGITFSGILIVLFYEAIHHISDFGSFLAGFLDALTPFIYGFCLAFILTPFRRTIENKWLQKFQWKAKAKRRVATGISMAIVIAALVLFIYILVPQLFSSVRTLATSMGSYARHLEQIISQYFGDESTETAALISEYLNGVGDKLLEWLTGAEGGMQQLVSYSWTVIQGIFDFFIGLVVAVYLLNDGERFKIQFNKVMFAVFPEKFGDTVNYVIGLIGDAFNKFIYGKALDSLIVGIVCYIFVRLMDMPYSPLIAFVVGLTNMIPVFGPFIGAIPCILILLMIDIWQAIEFTIFIIILQQIDGNILGPFILGGSMGLPTLWVMFAIIIGGAVFGIPGMFIGVPIFSVIYTLVRNWSNERLEKNKIKIENSGNGRIKE